MRYDLQTIIGSRIGTSVDVNGLFIPANSLAKYLRRFCEPALFHTEGAGSYHLTKSGSLVRVKVGQRYFALTSRHQVVTEQYKFDQLCLVSEDNKTLLTSHSVVFPDGDDYQNNDLDVLKFEFTQAVASGQLPASGWYDLKNDLLRDSSREPGLVCCIGYAGHRNTINYEEKDYPRAPNAVWGVEVKSTISGRLSFKPQPEITFDPAGMSGAPVFGISTHGETIKTFFAGILTNASTMKFNFISFTRLKQIIEKED